MVRRLLPLWALYLAACGPAGNIPITADNPTTEEAPAACVPPPEDPKGFSAVPGCFEAQDPCGVYCPNTRVSPGTNMAFGCSPALNYTWAAEGPGCTVTHMVGNTTYYCCPFATATVVRH